MNRNSLELTKRKKQYQRYLHCEARVLKKIRELEKIALQRGEYKSTQDSFQWIRSWYRRLLKIRWSVLDC